ncbi:linker for activation of T-cells family member 2 isoform X1 [Physeter macrocephalus]|uniref:Linker for activation of T-cells family member 2 isoform X1 n=1 Tax=Physeter macrocephalus TaxID=9755 RepID=A0A455B1V9_PHYMC|nr:linker for activation of T-cells family member 2 isoform X1 [Physeter catodon]|eukprot:XP_028342504.1 linker for activation of T-cells family member 2 isoform X1 [Physeter catodon]
MSGWQLAPAQGHVRSVGTRWAGRGASGSPGSESWGAGSPSSLSPWSVPPCPSVLSLCPWGCGRPGPGSAQLHAFPGKGSSRSLQRPGPIPWSGRPGQGPWWTRPPTRHQQGRTSCCSSPPASRILHPPGTRTSAKEVDADQMQPTSTPSPGTISIVGGSRSPRKMKMTPIPTRTCSSVSQRKPNQGTRGLRIIRTRHTSSSGGSPGESWRRSRGKHLPPR